VVLGFPKIQILHKYYCDKDQHCLVVLVDDTCVYFQNSEDIVRLLLDGSYKIDNNNDNDSELGSDIEDQKIGRVKVKKQLARQLFTVGRKQKSVPSTTDVNSKNTKHYINGE